MELRKPVLAFESATPDTVSLRQAQPMLGVGLLEAIPEADILAKVRTAPDEDGVKGTANYVFDPETGAVPVWAASAGRLPRRPCVTRLLLHWYRICR